MSITQNGAGIITIMSYLTRIAESYQDITLSREELAYYARHILLPSVGLDGQRKLKAARVLIVGAGGLGCPVLQALAGAGVGHMTIIDGDKVSISNISRQWLHSYKESGENKATSAKATLESLNPFIDVEAFEAMLTSEDANSLVGTHDIIVDATDDLKVRYVIDDVCSELDRPWVHAALYRDNSQLSVFWGRYGASFRKIYPYPSAAPSCAGAGMLGASASLVGNLQALEVIKLITGDGELKLGELVSINSRSMELQCFKLPDISKPKPINNGQGSFASKRLISAAELNQALSIHEPLTIVDLRENEPEIAPNTLHLSESRVIERGIPEDITGKAVLVCEEGLASSLIAEALSVYDERIYFLAGGAQALGGIK